MFAIGGLWLLCGGLWAQQTDQSSSPTQPQPQNQPAPIAAPDIADRSTQLAATVRAATADSQRSPQIEAIASSLSGLSTGIDDLASYSRAVIKSSPGVGGIAELVNTWQPVSARLDGWAAQVRQRAQQLEQDREKLEKAEKEWALTMQSPELAGLPDDVRNVVSGALASVRTARKRVAERRSDVLLLQSRIAEQQVIAGAVMEEVRAAEKVQRIGLIAFDSAPLWRIAELRSTPVPARPEIEFSSETAMLFRQYTMAAAVRLFFFIIFVLIAWFLLRRLRTHREVWKSSEDPPVRALALVVRRPVSSAIFLSVMATALVLPETPAWMINLAGLALLIPSLRLLPQLIADRVEYAYYGLIALVVIAGLIDLIPDHSAWSRPVWLVFQICVAGCLWWLWHAVRRNAAPGLRPAYTPWFAAWGFAVAVLGVIANVIGMVQLSEFVIRTILLTFYAAAIVRGMVVIVTGFVMVSLTESKLSFLAPSEESRSRLQRRTNIVLRVAGIITFVAVFLYLATLLGPVTSFIDYVLATELNFGAISITLYNLLSFAMVVAGAFVVSAALRAFMNQTVYKRLGFGVGQKDAFSKLLHYCVLFVGFLFAFAAAGVQLSHLAILAGGLGVGIGLGMQSIITNFVSGLILLFERPLQVGEFVVIGDGATKGFVKDIGIRATVIKTFEGADVIVPNGELTAGSFTNWSHSIANRRLEISVGIAYGSDVNQAMQILIQVAKGDELVLEQPPPEVLFVGFGASSLDFILRAWCNKPDWETVSTQIRKGIAEAFRQNNIQMPFPQRDLYIRSLPEGFAPGGKTGSPRSAPEKLSESAVP